MCTDDVISRMQRFCRIFDIIEAIVALEILSGRLSSKRDLLYDKRDLLHDKRDLLYDSCVGNIIRVKVFECTYSNAQ